MTVCSFRPSSLAWYSRGWGYQFAIKVVIIVKPVVLDLLWFVFSIEWRRYLVTVVIVHLLSQQLPKIASFRAAKVWACLPIVASLNPWPLLTLISWLQALTEEKLHLKCPVPCRFAFSTPSSCLVSCISHSTRSELLCLDTSTFYWDLLQSRYLWNFGNLGCLHQNQPLILLQHPLHHHHYCHHHLRGLHRSHPLSPWHKPSRELLPCRPLWDCLSQMARHLSLHRKRSVQ